MKYPKKLITRISTYVLFGCLTVMMACDMVNLDEQPKNFAAPENFYTTPAQVEAVFVSTMSRVWSSWNSYGWAMRAQFQNEDHQNGGNLVISENHGANLWSDHYHNIMNLNFAIGSLKEGRLEGVPQDRIDVLMGEAKFLRAWNYFQLVRLFGALPLPTEETEDYFNAQLPRSPISDVYDLIVSDFTTAIENLPPVRSERGRPNSQVAKGLLAKAYLTMATAPLNETSNYQKAADLAKEVIDEGNYSLVEDINDVFTLETEFGPEMMWSFISNYEHLATSPQIWSNIRGWGDISVQQEWLDTYPEQPRKHAYFELEDSEGVHHTELGRYAGVKKYQYDTEEDRSAGRSIINIPIIRYADVLLIFAEADNMANGGPTQAAVDAVNKVIDRANDYHANPEHPRLTTGMSMEDFDTAIINERSLELNFEFDRWFDLIRKRILKEASRESVQQNFDERIYLWPIPDNDMRLNPNLEQNPGY